MTTYDSHHRATACPRRANGRPRRVAQPIAVGRVLATDATMTRADPTRLRGCGVRV